MACDRQTSLTGGVRTTNFTKHNNFFHNVAQPFVVGFPPLVKTSLSTLVVIVIVPFPFVSAASVDAVDTPAYDRQVFIHVDLVVFVLSVVILQASVSSKHLFRITSLQKRTMTVISLQVVDANVGETDLFTTLSH